MLDLTHIKQPTGSQPGGTHRLFIIEAVHISSIGALHPVDKVIYENLTIAEDKRFSIFEFSPDTCRLSTPSRGNDGNSYFETLIDVQLSDDDPVKLDQFFKMINGRFIAVLDQASKEVKLCGSRESPLICRQVSYDAGGQLGDKNGTTFQFRSKGTLPVGYKGGIGITKWREKRGTEFCVIV